MASQKEQPYSQLQLVQSLCQHITGLKDGSVHFDRPFVVDIKIPLTVERRCLSGFAIWRSSLEKLATFSVAVGSAGRKANRDGMVGQR